MPIGFIGIPTLTIIPSTASKSYCHGTSLRSSLETQAGLPSQILKVKTACVRRLPFLVGCRGKQRITYKEAILKGFFCMITGLVFHPDYPPQGRCAEISV